MDTRAQRHARSFAATQPVAPPPTGDNLLAGRLASNGAVLLHAYRVIAGGIDERRAITPAAEWLADSYDVVQRQVREIHSALPSGYYQQLSKPFAGYPRLFRLGGRRATGARPAPEFSNGLGEFAIDRREYVTLLGPGLSTPAPWINVISSPSFGFRVAAEDCGYI